MGRQTISKIDEIVGRINTHPEYSKCVSQRFISSLRDDAYRHSVSIELESGGYLGKKDLEELRVKCYNQLKNGRAYLSKEDNLSLTTFATLGKIVEPIGHPSGNFRSEEVKYGDFYGVSPMNVPTQMDDLIWMLNEKTDIHPLDRAAKSHLEIIRIHPYNDGNGRIARLVQDFCLEQRGYPPAIIPIRQREMYLDILNNLWDSRLNKGVESEEYKKSEAIFYDLIHSAELDSLNKLQEELRKNRIYEVFLEGKMDKALLIGLTNSLKSFAEHKGKQIVANHIHKRREVNSFGVKGNISSEEIEKFLKKSQRKFKFKFKINSVCDW